MFTLSRHSLNVGAFLGLLLLGSLLIFSLAETPSRLEKEIAAQINTPPQKPIAVDVATPESSPPEAETPPAAPSADLAPSSFTQDASALDFGFGAAFGSGGSGPAVSSLNGGLNAQAAVAQATALDRGARVAQRTPLDYPASAKARGLSGFVLLRLRLDARGQIESVRVMQSEPQGLFDEAALRAVRAWRFEPALSGGKAVAAWVTQKIRFDLN